MEFRHLYSFLRVAELGSFTQAAQELGYSQPSISVHIQQLEEEIGCQLFEHIGNKNTLTENGVLLVQYARQIFQIQEKARHLRYNDVKEYQIYGSLQIGAPDSIIRAFIIDILDDFRQRYPNITVYIKSAISKSLHTMILKNELDLIFAMSSLPETNRLLCGESYLEKIVFVAHTGHPLAAKPQVSLREVLDYPIISTGEQTILQQKLVALTTKIDKDMISYIQIESVHCVAEMVKRGLGIAFLPQYATKAAAEKGELKELQVEGIDVSFYTNVSYHKDKYLSLQMTAFLETAKKYLMK